MKKRSLVYRLSLICALGVTCAIGCSDDSSKASGTQETADQKGNENAGGGENGGSEGSEKTCPDVCPDGQTCENGECVPSGSSDACSSCTSEQECKDGKCVPKDQTETCDVKCGNVCCAEGMLCDIVTEKCAEPCSDGSATCNDECCAEGQECDAGWYCIDTCSEGETRCVHEFDMTEPVCCNSEEDCVSGMCMAKCVGTDRCGENCCPSEAPVCENAVCKIACDAATGTRCGAKDEFCCDNATQLCLFDKCVTKGVACENTNQCSFDEFCEAEMGICINEDDVPSTCQVIPSFTKFKALPQWHWPNDLEDGTPSTDQDSIRVIVVPLVANLTDDDGDGDVDVDDTPDVVFISYSTKVGPDTQAPSVIRVISGDNGHEIASSAPRYWTYPTVLALADVDNDGKTEIIAGTNNHRSYNGKDYSTGDPNDYLEVLSVEESTSSTTGYELKTKYQLKTDNGSRATMISVADIDADGTPEILTTFGIASVRKNESGSLELAWREGCHKSLSGPLHAADLDGDHQMELVSASVIYDNHCNVLANGGSGGFIAIADLMPSGADAAETGELVPEIAHAINRVGDGSFKFTKIYKKANEDGTYTWSMKDVWEALIPVDRTRNAWKSTKCDEWIAAGQTGSYSSTHLCRSGGGTPVIADFNGDKIADVGVAARYYYIVYSNDGTATGGQVLWADSTTQDYSSASTGSSVFDFEGDGIAEVVYGDETKLHVYSGLGSGKDGSDSDSYNDPSEIFSVTNWSATGQEYPIVVDVDNDGSTEIVIASDLYPKDDMSTVGVRAFEDPGGQWVRTRRIWNQHHYHVTNINEDGTVPVIEEPNWENPKLNNYRQNVQPGGVYNAPNLVASGLSVDTNACEAGAAYPTLIATIENQGALNVKAGVKVSFYASNVNDTDKTAYLGTAVTTKALYMGSSATVSFIWDGKGRVDGVEGVDINSPVNVYFVVDEPTDDKAMGEFVECIETDNTLAAPLLVSICNNIL